MKNILVNLSFRALICICLVVISACSPQASAATAEPTLSPVASLVSEPTATEPPQSQRQTFTSERFSYSFQYPAGWIIKDKPGEWAEFDPLDPNRTNGIDAFAGYINGRNLTIGIGARPLPEGETLDSWVETAKSLITAGVSKGVCYEATEDDPLSENAIILDGEPALMLEYVCPNDHDSFGLVALSVHKNQGYWITWIAPQGNAEADRAEFAQILSTFSFVE
jgi:hypothetical protein